MVAHILLCFQYENALKMRRERFIEELDGYSRQVEEFVGFGDMQEIGRYLKKAQALQARLDAAQEKSNTHSFERAQASRSSLSGWLSTAAAAFDLSIAAQTFAIWRR